MRIAVTAILFIAFLSACGGSGGDDPLPVNQASAAQSNWDEMDWNEGEWQ